MKAITLWPEWAWAICALGKNVENRTWRPTLRNCEQFAIHAGNSFGGYLASGLTIEDIFEPVFEMASRAGWSLGYQRTGNLIKGRHESSQASIEQEISKIPTGKVVAITTLLGVRDPSKGGNGVWPWWAEDQYGWMLRDTVVLPRPVLAKGCRSLWYMPDDVLDAVTQQICGQSAGR